MWNNDLILELIALYETKPIIWDTSQPEHRDRFKVNEAWRSIATELSADISVSDIKRKIDSLRAAYRNIRRKIEETQSKGLQEDCRPTWFAFEPLDRFLWATRKNYQTLSFEGLLDEPDETGEIATNGENIAMEKDEAEKPLEIVEMAAGSRMRHYNDSFPARRRNPVDKDVKKHLKQASDALRIIAKRQAKMVPAKEKEDEWALYGQLIATKLRSLSLRGRLTAQNKIDNFIFNAQMEEINFEDAQEQSNDD